MLKDGTAHNYQYIFKDHFLLVGPKDGIEGIDLAPVGHNATKEEIVSVFKSIGQFGAQGSKPIYITRDDGSGTDIKEKGLWAAADVTLPTARDQWYYRMPADKPRFPADCLKLAQEWHCLTLIDRGTFLMNAQAQEHLAIYLYGSDDNNDILLNPCHALETCVVSALSPIAHDFVTFMASSRGQNILRTFGVGNSTNILGLPLFSPAQT